MGNKSVIKERTRWEAKSTMTMSVCRRKYEKTINKYLLSAFHICRYRNEQEILLASRSLQSSQGDKR